nr:retrotransposon-related protein [Tanacetum cinerariifolium]
MCFYCDEKYFPGHKCSDQLHSLEVVIKGTEDTGEEVFEECTTELFTQDSPNDIAQDASPQISIHALSGVTSHRTMRIRGYVGKQMQSVVEGYFTVFYSVDAGKGCMPNTLPLKRSHDHHIPLLPNTPLINIRPYRHPPNQKDVIELMVKELIDSRVIRPSQSLFSSPIVMVKKKDGSWRMCIDYRQLNKHTDKDKFPIPMIEELIEELQGSVIFSKLDLRSGYHQIRIRNDDIHKIDFRTHDGHFEFLVMPFGLKNAPSTFQSLMNTVFKQFLRRFTLVLFDDILVYSINEVEHLHYLECVLQVMRKKTLELQPLSKPSGYLNYLVLTMKFPIRKEIKDSWQQDQTLKELIEKLKRQTNNSTKYTWSNGQLRRKGKLIFGKVDQLRKQLFLHCHGDVVVYGQKPPIYFPYLAGESTVEAVDRMAILERRMGNVNNKPEVFVLVQWSNRDKEEATYERFDDLMASSI